MTDKASTYPAVLDELLPGAFHNTAKHANNAIENDHGRLKARLRPMRGLKQDRSARVIIAGHALIQNLRRGHYELAVDAPPPLRLERAVVINEAFYGTTHPQVAITLGNLGGVRWKMGDTAEAIGLLERALAVSEAIYGHDHPYTARVRTALSEAHPAPGGEA